MQSVVRVGLMAFGAFSLGIGLAMVATGHC
jgi:hypothetical protein